MNVTLLSPSNESAYEEMIRRREDSLLYTSLKYRNLLRIYLDAEPLYLIASQGNTIVGALPLFLKRNSVYGNLLNSLPFYGSNGGIVISPEATEPEKVFYALADGLHHLAREVNAISATIITSPFEPYVELYEQCFSPTFRDSRVAQVKLLPHHAPTTDHDLMATFHRHHRRAIRKVLKSNVTFTKTCDEESLRFLAETHQENMRAIEVTAKEWQFFELVPQVFECESDFLVYVASIDGLPISALLLFYYNRTVEYYTPVTLLEHRSTQANSLLIFEAMMDATRRGFRYWNFGGTRPTQQEGVYRFKERWGAQDMPYRYFVIRYQDMDHFLDMTPQRITTEYPSFYVLPFSCLKSQEQ